jgi:hypothetical protein
VWHARVFWVDAVVLLYGRLQYCAVRTGTTPTMETPERQVHCGVASGPGTKVERLSMRGWYDSCSCITMIEPLIRKKELYGAQEEQVLRIAVLRRTSS